MANLSRNSARRMAEATRRSEQTPRFRAPEARHSQGIGPDVYMEVTVLVTVKSGSTLGKGKGKLKTVTYDSSDVATIADHPDTTEYPIYSAAVVSTATIAVGRVVAVAPMYGRYHVIVDYCTT